MKLIYRDFRRSPSSVELSVCAQNPKICNGARLGPLILLECQECQETYHPLCHQPPIVDVDVYDPRFVWRCRRCVETSTATSAKFKPAGKEEKIRRGDDTAREIAGMSGLRTCARRDVDLFGKNGTPHNYNSSFHFRQTTRRARYPHFV